jgi:hypothetical protein
MLSEGNACKIQVSLLKTVDNMNGNDDKKLSGNLRTTWVLSLYHMRFSTALVIKDVFVFWARVLNIKGAVESTPSIFYMFLCFLYLI